MLNNHQNFVVLGKRTRNPKRHMLIDNIFAKKNHIVTVQETFFLTAYPQPAVFLHSAQFKKRHLSHVPCSAIWIERSQLSRREFRLLRRNNTYRFVFRADVHRWWILFHWRLCHAFDVRKNKTKPKGNHNNMPNQID